MIETIVVEQIKPVIENKPEETQKLKRHKVKCTPLVIDNKWGACSFMLFLFGDYNTITIIVFNHFNANHFLDTTWNILANIIGTNR